MKHLKFVFIFIVLVNILTLAQTALKISPAKEGNNSRVYPVDARERLEQYYKLNGMDPSKFVIPAPALRKTSAWNFQVGNTKTFSVADLTPGSTYSTSFTCRAVGVHCYIFVEDTSWTKYVNQAAVDSVRIAFDSKTPANPNKGIYQTDVDNFGNPPDVDNDPKIIILILNIRDGFKGTGGFVAGFFSASDESAPNKAEIYHLDCYPLNLKSSDGLQTGMATTAHEFQHMIHYNYHQDQETFFNEGCSMVAEVINGYKVDDYLGYYSQTPNRYLLYWNGSDATDVLNDYGRCTSFMLYLKEQFWDTDNTFFKKFVESKLTSINAFDNDVFPTIGTTRRFADILIDWWLANSLNDMTVDAKWGYKYANVPAPVSTYIGNPNITSGSGSVYKQAATYISYTNGKNLSFNINTNGKTGIKIKAIEIGPTKQVVDVTPLTNFSVADFGTNISKVIFLICHNDNNDFENPGNPSPFPFTYTSAGTVTQQIQEIAYDTTEPTGVYPWSPGDSVAVLFDGYSGAKLDSIRVALRTLSSLTGRIRRSALSNTGALNTTGKILAASITATGKVYVSGSIYPPHWTNWVKVDLRNYSIDASSSFLVSFAIDGAYTSGASSGPNRVMSTYQPTSTSWTYTTNGGTRKWWGFFVDQSYPPIDSNIVYLIRAYVSYTASGVKETVELLPTAYSLDQNYPNPFNPSTIIRYELPKAGNVQIKIFNSTGQEVRSLLDDFEPSGTHNLMWDARDNHGQHVSSGIYFYRIVAGDFVQTKKMILLK